jgi:beta-glucosidase
VLEGIHEKLGPEVKVVYAKGPDIRRAIPSPFEEFAPGPKKPLETPEQAEAAFQQALAAARSADRIVMVLGERADMAGEAASRASLALSGRQQELLEAVVALGKPVVLVLVNGRPLAIEWAAEHVPAILEAWQPGSEGGRAIADVLFGDVNPGGKLPVTFPRESQTPVYYAHNLSHQPEGSKFMRSRYWDAPSSPVYPFGYGLSYTTFAYANVKLAEPTVKVGQGAIVTADVRNTGSVAGDEVVQLYIHQKYGSDSRPERELKGFERIALQPGEARQVRFTLGPEELGYWSTAQGRWVQEAAPFDVWVGGDSTAEAHVELTVTP